MPIFEKISENVEKSEENENTFKSGKSEGIIFWLIFIVNILVVKLVWPQRRNFKCM